MLLLREQRELLNGLIQSQTADRILLAILHCIFYELQHNCSFMEENEYALDGRGLYYIEGYFIFNLHHFHSFS